MKTKKWAKKTVEKCKRRLRMYWDILRCESMEAARRLHYTCDFCNDYRYCRDCPCFPNSSRNVMCLISSKTAGAFRDALRGDDILTLQAAARARYTYLRRLFLRKGIDV